jgi:polysaccharide export outer membrane protein
MLRLCIFVTLLTLLRLAGASAQTNSESPTHKTDFAERDKRYRIQPNDVIEVQFRYTPEYNLTATVQPDGYITSQIAGQVKVGGLTLSEAEALISQTASARLKDPEVTVVPKDFVKPRFVVAGEVNHPGPQELRGDIGIIEAIAMGGGFKESAQRSQVVLVRKMDSEYAQVRVFDLKKLMRPENIREQVKIQPDDLIVVPQNRISRLEPVIRIASLGLYGLSGFPIR